MRDRFEAVTARDAVGMTVAPIGSEDVAKRGAALLNDGERRWADFSTQVVTQAEGESYGDEWCIVRIEADA